MTKPNDFILNSDYLSLAQTNKSTTEFTAYFPAEHFDPGYSFDRTRDFTVPYSPGAIDMFLMSVNNGPWYLASAMNLAQDSALPIVEVLVYRTNAITIQVRFHEANWHTGGEDIPAYTIKVRVSSFKPPNVF